ncbi:Holliday junction endonuclease RuvC [Seinonella peptonophila]|uniref:Holliday junction endonuclease RuvC n=1 Tax=Seinonella peptonophila TaxID=112248 RepID=A0A1M4VEQ5_9BACL|nr:crossover junction endodeoxyribonuclease RuvC [Seinonella peptonophila]SHE67320.1 Holliday junction endonuclease RuvC [Seinonella peptonophila]
MLGLDLSLSSPGYAVIEAKKGVYKLLEVGHIKAKPKHTLTQKLKRIQYHISRLILDYDIDVVVIESGYVRHNQATKAIQRVVGAVYSILDCEVKELPPTTIKKRVAGTGKASKEEVQKVVSQMLGNYQFENEDESDACAVCIAFLIGEDDN